MVFGEKLWGKCKCLWLLGRYSIHPLVQIKSGPEPRTFHALLISSDASHKTGDQLLSQYNIFIVIFIEIIYNNLNFRINVYTILQLHIFCCLNIRNVGVSRSSGVSFKEIPRSAFPSQRDTPAPTRQRNYWGR